MCLKERNSVKSETKSTAKRVKIPYSAFVIATRYELDGPGIETRWGARFSAPVQTGSWGPPSLLYNGYRLFPGGKAAGAWC